MKRLVFLTGAGVSADSGLATFRDSDGLWAKYRIEDVCTPEALARNRDAVIDFYNLRRRECFSKEPNAGHFAIREMEEWFEVDVVTQNVDDLHERAGSSRVLHLHGELRKLRSQSDPGLIYTIDGWEQRPGDRAEDGSLLRPHIVFFGEPVPEFENAVRIVQRADILVVAGTSLAVYPAASLVHYAPAGTPLYIVDPADLALMPANAEHIKERSATGLPKLAKTLLETYLKK